MLLTNKAKGKVLAFAAQQQMSDMKYEQRLMIGTVESDSIQVVIALLRLTQVLMGCSPCGREESDMTGQFHALEKETATYSSVLAWRIPGTEESDGLQSMRWQRVGLD